MRSHCLPFRLGLTGAEDKSVPRKLIERVSGELVRENRKFSDIVVLRSGWAARSMMFPDGRRQIVDIALPGEFIGCSDMAMRVDGGDVQRNPAVSVVALSDVTACVFENRSFISVVEDSAQTMLEVMRTCGESISRLKVLLAAVGRQSGAPRIAAFLMTLHRRLIELGQATHTEMPYYLRQKDLADTLGMTQVHVSRTLRSLEEGGLLGIREKELFLHNPDKLERLSRG